jgi:hypothetical protein
MNGVVARSVPMTRFGGGVRLRKLVNCPRDSTLVKTIDGQVIKIRILCTTLSTSVATRVVVREELRRRPEANDENGTGRRRVQRTAVFGAFLDDYHPQFVLRKSTERSMPKAAICLAMQQNVAQGCRW